MKKIVMLGPVNPNLSGGQITHVENMVKCFQGNLDIDLEIFATSYALYNQENKFYKALRTIYRLFLFIPKLVTADFIHINSTMDVRSLLRDSLYAVLCVLLNKPFLIQFHGGSITNIKIGRNVKWILNIILSKAKYILVLTNLQRDSLSVFRKITVLKAINYIELPKVQLERRTIPEKLNLLYLGRIERSKGVFDLINACGCLKEKAIDFQLIIAGSGPEIDELKCAIKNLSLENYVHSIGVVSGLKKDSVFSNASLLVLPSYSEGLPYSILEAISYGIPIITTPVGAIPDILQHGKEGMFIDVNSPSSIANTIECLSKDKLKISMMSDYALLKSKKFSLEEMRQYFMVLWEVI